MTDNTAPEWFRGAWKRQWFTEDGQPPTENYIVRDLQTPTVFGSVRIPIDRPAMTATSFDELDDTQLAALVAQRGGFVGVATFNGKRALWDHAIDFKPKFSEDTANLTPTGPLTVLEEGLQGEFSELWWKMSSGDGKYLGIQITRGGRLERMLVVVGDHFIYARNRKADLPRAKSMAELVESTKATRAQIVEILDCELSYGLVNGGRFAWEIRHSTLPWREGKPLDFAREIAIDDRGTPRVSTADAQSVPMNTFTRDELLILFPAAR